MEQEDRKKKLAAGKEKLAAFRKKRAKRKKTEDGAGVSIDSTQNSANGMEDGSLVNASSLSDLNSFTGESDQYSLTSGDEWSAEESDLQAAVHYQAKLTAATQRIAELEEALEGKQLALDRMVLETQLSDSSPHKVTEGSLSGGDLPNSVKGSVQELQDALEQRDKIIRQLTARLQETVAAKSNDASDDRPDYMEETQHLSQQVVLLQKQLTQAGETVEQQVAMCQMSVRALQEAKAQILALQGKVTEKNNLLQQLSYTLTARSSEVMALKQREAELEQLVQVLEQQAPNGNSSGESELSQSAASRAASLEQELERLGAEHAQSLKAVAELQQQLALSESARQSLASEKEEAVRKIVGLEEELDQLGQVRDDALEKMSDLEHRVREGSALLGAECGSQSGEASERIAQLEREIVELNDEHRAHVDRLNQRHSSLEAQLAEHAGASPGNLSDLKNVINSQQREILSLHQQLKSTQEELSSSREQAASLQDQLDQLQNKHKGEQEEAAGILRSIQLEVQTLREENAHYQQQMALAQEQVHSFKDSLQSVSSLPTSDDVKQGEASPLESWQTLDKLYAESDLPGQIQLLQKSYAHLLTQYTQKLEKKHQLPDEVQSVQESEETCKEQSATIQHLTAEVSQLQAEVDRLAALVQEKDSEISKLSVHLQAVIKEKESLAFQLKEREQLTEQQTLESDTLRRKMESRANTLLSEVTQCKEALRESESANLELQEKLDAQLAETDSLKLQLAASEDLMKQLQSKVNADDTRARLELVEAELQAALEDKKVLSQLQALLEEKDLKLQAVEKEKEAAAEGVTKHEEGLKVVQLQLAEASQQHQAALAQQEQLVSSHHEEVLRLRENLKERSVELQNTILQKEQAEALLASTLDSKVREMQELQDKLDRKSKDLGEIGTEKEQLLSDLDSVTADKGCEIQRIQLQLEQKAKEVEQLMSSLASAEVDRETEVQKIQVLLEEKTKEVERIIVEKEQLISTFNLTEADINERFQDLQQKLDQKSEECQTLLVEKEELANRLSNQQSAIAKELADLQESLLQKGQECDILLSENEQLHEELHSKSSAHAREIECLKLDLDQQTHKFEILLSDWDNLETEFHSRDSASKWEMQKISEKLNETVKELEAVRTELVDVKDAMDSKDDTIKNLHSEVKLLQEQLTFSETAGDEALQDRQQALDVLQSQVHELKQDLVTTSEENDSLLSRLAGQADMFKMKEEEMVTENNALNHQLEEVRSEAQEMASQLQQQLDGLQGELESTRLSLQTQEDELSKLREEDHQQKETLDSLNESNTALVKEKEQLVAKICSLEANVEEIQKDLDSQVDTLQAEVDGLRQDKDHQWSEFDKERVQLQEKNTVLKDQLDSCTSEIEQLHKSLKDAVAEQDKLKADMDTLHQQQDALQLDFSVQLEEAQSQVSSKESELQSLQAQLRDSNALLANQVQSLQEELAAAQAEVVQKDSILASTIEELTTAKSQMERLAEEKEMLKSNFDCCMEDMTQRAAENDNTIRQLQGRLMEASNNVDRDQGQMREMYESQLSELEDRLAAGDLELQRLERIAESTNAEKEKLKEHFNGQIADLELTIQSAESELSHLREQMSKKDEAHKKEIADLKHSYEIQIMSVEENCQSLEKALAKQDSMMLDVSSRFERDRTEREKAYDQQLSEAYEQVRLHEMDVARVKRQLDEMRKDHQREQQELQKSMETQIFDLENKCVITMSELERMRQSLWSMEEDHSGETQSLRNRIQELEALSHNQEKQISDLQDKLIQSSQQSDDSVSSLRESYQSEVAHLDGLNQQLSGDVENLQDQLKTMQRTQMQEAEALKHEHNQTMGVVQERCRRAEHYSQVLQSHMDSASGSADNPELFILTAETERLQQELAAAEASIAHLQLQLKETQASYQTKISELTDQVRTLTSDKRANSTHIEHLTEDLENEKQMLQESQMFCQDLEEENKHLTAENSSLRHQAPQPHTAEEMESRFVSSEEDGTVTELKQQINHLTQELRRVQMRNDDNCVPVAKERTGFVAEGGFEPEPDSLGYLDLAVGPKAGEDYFVEETEPSKGPLKTRTKSVPSEMLVAVEDEQARMLATFQTLQSAAQRVGNNEGLLLETGEGEGGDAPVKSGDAGQFEPEEDSSLPSLGGGKGLGPASEVGPHQPADVIVDSFQPESQPITPITECPAGAPVLSFLPHPVGVLPETKAEGKFVEAVDSSTQTEKGDRDHPAEDTPDAVVTLTARQRPQAAENSGDPSQDANALDENLSDVAEAEFSRHLRSLQDQLEEEWVLKMRSQEVELRHTYDLEFKEFQRETEHKCQQQIRQVRQETQASFVDAVRKMRKSMKKKQKEEQTQTKALKEKLAARSSRSDLGVPEGTDDKKLGEIIKQLNDENQELQEVRDVLLEQIAIFQTQGRRHAMQHELQALISRGSRLSPSQSLKLTSGTDSDQDQASPRSSEVFEPVVQPAEVEPLAASESQALYSSDVVGCEGAATARESQDNDDPASQSTPTAGSDDEDDRSEGSSVRNRFLEELEEMSQQSGQDLPLEWELTSTTVAHASSGGGAGAFERDQAGTGSVWEVFDGRCLRQDCREVRHRYNNLFHWLSRVCSLPTKPTLQGKASTANQVGGGLMDSHRGEEEGGGQGEGEVEAGVDELNSVFFASVRSGTDVSLETGRSLEIDPEDAENVHLSERELLSRLLTVETPRISLEQLLSSHLQLLDQEREELRLREDALQSRCDDVENTGSSPVQELAALECSGRVSQSEIGEEVSKGISAEAQEMSIIREDHDHLGTEGVGTLQEPWDSLQSQLNSLQADNQLLTQQLSAALIATSAQQEETVKLQQREQMLEEKCVFLQDKVQTLKRENESLQKDLTLQQNVKEESAAKCSALTKELEAVSSNQQKEGVVEEKCVVLQEEVQMLKRENESLQKDLTLQQRRKEESTARCSALAKELEAVSSNQQKEGVVEEKLVFLEDEVQTLKRENELLQKDLTLQQRMKEESTAKCSALVKELEAVSDYQEVVRKRDILQSACSSLEEQLASIQEDVSQLQDDNQNLLQEKQELNTKGRELQEKVGRLEDLEDKYKALEESYKMLQEHYALLQSQTNLPQEILAASDSKSFSTHEVESAPSRLKKNSSGFSLEDYKILCNKVESLQDENRSLQEKIDILEESNKSLEDRCEAIQERNKLLQEESQTHDSKAEGLQAELQFVKENLQAAEKMNSSLLDKVFALEALKDKDGSLQAKNKSLQDKCAALAQENKALSIELSRLRDADKNRKGDRRLLEAKCQALQDELLEATRSGQSLREQLHEQSITLENVISEMREGSQESATLGHDRTNRKQEVSEEEDHTSHFAEGQFAETEEDLRCQLSKLEQVLSEKDDLIAELKEQMTVLSLQQAAMGSPRAQRETTRDLELEAQQLREELIEKDNIIQELQAQVRSLKQRVKEDSDLVQEVSILHQALFEKEQVIHKLKETATLLQLSHQDKSQMRPVSSGTGQMPGTDRQERTLPGGKADQQRESKSQDRRTETTPERSVESSESLGISSDPDSDIIPGQDVDLMKEMGRLRKDIKKTKAVYASESALFQEALDREPVSQLGVRSSRSPSSTIDFSEMTQNDIPDDTEQLKKIVVKLLEENKSLTTESLRLQLHIREQEELVLKMEEQLPNNANPPEEDWQSLFERQLLLLQKQRDELLQQICERDSGVRLLSTRIGKTATWGATLHHQQEDLTAKMSELEHCHQLLQQRQAELAHCQAEKRHLEQLLLLKDETERQLMRQKRLLEEELATIEGKLQEREATLVEEKARLMKELKEKELHIFHLQTSQVSHPLQQSSRNPAESPQRQALMGRPRSTSTPLVSSRSLSSQAFFLQSPDSHQEELSTCPRPQDEGAKGGSFLEEPDPGPTTHRSQPPDPELYAFEQDASPRPLHHGPGQLASRRHSTGTTGPGRFSHAPIPKDPEEMYKFHREAVERLRDKLQLEMEAEMARLSEGQAAAITGYWQRHNKQVP